MFLRPTRIDLSLHPWPLIDSRNTWLNFVILWKRCTNGLLTQFLNHVTQRGVQPISIQEDQFRQRRLCSGCFIWPGQSLKATTQSHFWLGLRCSSSDHESKTERSCISSSVLRWSASKCENTTAGTDSTWWSKVRSRKLHWSSTGGKGIPIPYQMALKPWEILGSHRFYGGWCHKTSEEVPRSCDRSPAALN
jgi:hypothetical protein